MLLDLVNRISSERRVKKSRHPSLGTLKVLSAQVPLGDVLRTSRINLPGMFLERQIKTSPRRHFRTSRGRQIGTSPGRSSRILGDVLGMLEGDVLGTSWGFKIFRLATFQNGCGGCCFEYLLLERFSFSKALPRFFSFSPNNEEHCKF